MTHYTTRYGIRELLLHSNISVPHWVRIIISQSLTKLLEHLSSIKNAVFISSFCHFLAPAVNFATSSYFLLISLSFFLGTGRNHRKPS